MNEKKIGKIKIARLGFGGCQDAQIGLTFDLGSEKDSWGVGDFWGDWSMKRSSYAKWTEEDRILKLGKMVMSLNKLLSDAKVNSLDKLVGRPVEVEFQDSSLKSWRILTEAI